MEEFSNIGRWIGIIGIVVAVTWWNLGGKSRLMFWLNERAELRANKQRSARKRQRIPSYAGSVEGNHMAAMSEQESSDYFHGDPGRWYAVCRHCGFTLSEEQYRHQPSVVTGKCSSLSAATHEWIIAKPRMQCRYCGTEILGKDLPSECEKNQLTSACPRSPTHKHYWT